MIDVPTEMTTSPSILYLDPQMAGGLLLDGPIEEGGGSGGAHGYFNPNNYYKLASDRAVQSDGYVLIDYDGDKRYDQAWFSKGGVWHTDTGGGWTVDDGPMDELIDLWERGFIL